MSISKGATLYKRSNGTIKEDISVPETFVMPSVTVSTNVTEVIDTDSPCKWCVTGHLIPCNSELICDNCGGINARYHSYDSDLSYIDGSMQLKGHKTTVNKWTPKSSVSTYRLKQIGRKRIYVNTDIPYRERQLSLTFKMIDSKCNQLLDSKTITNIKDMYFKLSDSYIIKTNKIGFVASIASMCCRINNCPRSDQEIATMFNISVSSLTKGVNCVTERMLQLGMGDTIETTTTAIAIPHTFVNRICTGLAINNESFVDKVNSVLTSITEMGVVDNIDEASVTGATILYVATLDPFVHTIKINKKDVHKLCCTSIATINRCYKLVTSNMSA
jgi:transcription initiation factor TFIIIB Brf1 subunit/transcription initiation factor TFIIB